MESDNWHSVSIKREPEAEFASAKEVPQSISCNLNDVKIEPTSGSDSSFCTYNNTQEDHQFPTLTFGSSLLENHLLSKPTYFSEACNNIMLPASYPDNIPVNMPPQSQNSNPSDTSNKMGSEPRRCIMLTDLPSSSSNKDPSEQPVPSSDLVHANPFQVDTRNIQSVPVTEQASELQELGLRVFNQNEFEEGVMAQVDKALQAQEEERIKKILARELKDVQEEVKSTKQELHRIDRALKLCNPQPNDKETQRRLRSIKQQKENKVKQLKKLQAKQKKLTIKVQGSAERMEELGDESDKNEEEEPDMLGLPTKETEMERKIRLGEMTPFGNVVQHMGPRLSTPSEMSDFDKYLLDQGAKRIKAKGKHLYKKQESAGHGRNSPAEPPVKKSKLHKSKSSSSVLDKTISKSDSSVPNVKKILSDGEATSSVGVIKRKTDGNFFDAKDKRHYRPSERDFSNWTTSRYKRKYPRLKHNFSGDAELSDYDDNEEDCYYDDADYVPDEREMLDSFNDEELGEVNSYQGPSPKTKSEPGNRRVKQEADSDLDVEFNLYDADGDIGAIKSKYKKTSARNQASRARDDGSFAAYDRRIKAWKKQKVKEKKEKIERGEDESESEDDMEFEGGFCVPGKLWNKLYRYQQTGVQWLWELHNQQAGGIVGDEMGLGKTIQIIAFLTGLRHSKLKDRSTIGRYVGLGPTLIVCPATVMHQWVKEFHTWWPAFRVAILHSSGSCTTSAVNLVEDIVQSHGVLVTAYSTVVLKQEILIEQDWHYVILDEGHKIRNPDAQVTIACKQLRTCHRLILSGSPVQNNLKELWSLFDFVFPGKLGTLPDFMTNFSVPIVQGGYSNASQVQVQTAYKCACVLRDTINPYLIRRMKADVKSNLQLPNKNEQVLFCRLTEEQREVYKEYLASKECNMILNGNFMVFPGLITLRKICNHPDLSTGGPKEFGSIPEGYDEETVEYGHWSRSGKMLVVRSLLKIWKKQGHRVLLFSQSKEMLNIMENFVGKQGYTYMRMDGGTSIASRQPLITKFNNDPSIFVFLLTTRVGGLGVNLTGANRVVIYDPDWNPSTDTQARERAWRIGQKKQVTVYRLMTTGTIEEKIYHRQIFKQFLSNRVLKDPKQRRFFKSNDLYELFSLGDDEQKTSTETSAIFAGTGSDIRVKSRKYQSKASEKAAENVKPNRFDELHARRNPEESVCWNDEEDEVINEENSVVVEEENKETPVTEEDTSEEGRLKRIREMARKLSMKIGGQNDNPPSEESRKTSRQNSHESSEVEECSVDGYVSKDGNHSSKCHVKYEKNKDDSNIDSSQASSQPAKSDRKNKKKHKKKKKKKDAKFEGERIHNLDHVGVYKSHDQETEEEKSHDKLDDYVLEKLFKKSGVHSAMQHDKIMMSSNPDYALVEGEANRVAKEAARALKASRAKCRSSTPGVPTWTGQSGSAGAPSTAKPRFGLKKNSKLLPTATVVKSASPKPTIVKQEQLSPQSMKNKSEQKSNQHFDGSIAGNRKMTGAGSSSSHSIISSSELISKMRSRNHLTKSGNGEVYTESDSAPTNIDSSYIEMITDIRNFVAIQSRVDGQATTNELLDEFSSRLPHEDSAKFKAMLKEVCFFRKQDGVGVWYLRPEFR